METINEPRILDREFFLETAFQRAHNSWKHQKAQLSPMQFNSDWEETLNDIDELIQSELGCSLSGLSPYDAAHLSNKIESRERYTQFKTKTSSSDPLKWNLSGNKNKIVHAPQKSTAAKATGHVNNNNEDIVEVQILDLRDVYEKKTKKGPKGLEYRLENPKVMVKVHADLEITEVCAFVKRCARAAMRTHDKRGAVKLTVSVLEKEKKRQVISVDLGSVYMNQDGDNFYWLEKADVTERNKWEVTLKIDLVSGLTARATSRPFRVTTKVHYKRNIQDYSSVGKVQNLICNVMRSNQTSSDNDHVNDDVFLESNEMEKNHFRQMQDTRAMADDNDDNLLTRNLLCFKLDETDDWWSIASSNDVNDSSSVLSPLAPERIILQPNTILQRPTVASYFGQKSEISCIVEQPELSGLLKLVRKRTTGESATTKQEKKTRRKKSLLDANYAWACGYCFFERRKKSTIRAHLIQGVCQRSRLYRRKSKKRRSFSARGRLLSNGLENSDLEKHKGRSKSW